MPVAPAFDNSYARLPEPFRHSTWLVPRASPTLIRLTGCWPRSSASIPTGLRRPTASRPCGGQAAAGGAEPIATGVRRAPVRPLHRSSATAEPSCWANTARRQAARDIQFKGTGRTPFSRGGDGRAALGPMLREYVVSEAMAALGIPTTRSLAVVTTGETGPPGSPQPGAVLTRVAASHIRVGTFEYVAARRRRSDPAGAGRLRDRPPLPGTVGRREDLAFFRGRRRTARRRSSPAGSTSGSSTG